MPALLHWGNTAYPDYLPLITASYRSSPQYDRSLRLAAFFQFDPACYSAWNIQPPTGQSFQRNGISSVAKAGKSNELLPEFGQNASTYD